MSARVDLDFCIETQVQIFVSCALTCPFFPRGQEFGRLVTAIIGMAANTVDSRVPKSNTSDWDCLALRVLATLSYKLKGSGNYQRALWPTVSSNLPFLEQQLTRLLVGKSMIGITQLRFPICSVILYSGYSLSSLFFESCFPRILQYILKSRVIHS